MTTPTFYDQNKLTEIIALSQRLGTDSNKLIDMMQHHTTEIKELFDSKNKHFAVETGDLMILSLQLLLMEGYSVDEIMDKCYSRFDKKLNGVLENG